MKKKFIIFVLTAILSLCVFAACDTGRSTSYEVSFDRGNLPQAVTVTGMPSARTVNEGGKVIRPSSNPTAEGWTFIDWYTQNSGGSAFDFSTSINADTTIYARWEEETAPLYEDYALVGTEQHELTFVDEEDFTGYQLFVNLNKNDKVEFYVGGDKIEFYTPENLLAPVSSVTVGESGSYFFAIVNDSGIWAVAYGLISEEEVYKVTYDRGNLPEGIEITDWIDEDYVFEGDLIERPNPDPSAEGWSFLGWFTAKNGNTPFNFTVAPADDVVVYAKWEENTPVTKYSVTFDANGENVTGMPQNMTGLLSGATVERPATDPERTGYNFLGWYPSASAISKITFPVTVGESNIVIYARWELISTGDAIDDSSFYLTGGINGASQVWYPFAQFKLVPHGSISDMLVLLDVTLKAGDEIKVVKGDLLLWPVFIVNTSVGTLNEEYGNMIIAADGKYDIYYQTGLADGAPAVWIQEHGTYNQPGDSLMNVVLQVGIGDVQRRLEYNEGFNTDNGQDSEYSLQQFQTFGAISFKIDGAPIKFYVDPYSVGFDFADINDYSTAQSAIILDYGTYDFYLKHYANDADDVWVLYLGRTDIDPSNPNPEPNPIDPDKYYLTGKIGGVTDWTPWLDLYLVENAEVAGEYMLLGIELKSGDIIKVVKGDSLFWAWFEDGITVGFVDLNGNLVIVDNGTYDIYFKLVQGSVWVGGEVDKSGTEPVVEGIDLYVDNAKEDKLEYNEQHSIYGGQDSEYYISDVEITAAADISFKAGNNVISLYVDRYSTGITFNNDEDYDVSYTELSLAIGTYDIYLKHYAADGADEWIIYIARTDIVSTENVVVMNVNGRPVALEKNESFIPSGGYEVEYNYLGLVTEFSSRLTFTVDGANVQFYLDASMSNVDGTVLYDGVDTTAMSVYDIYFKGSADGQSWQLFAARKPMTVSSADILVGGNAEALDENASIADEQDCEYYTTDLTLTDKTVVSFKVNGQSVNVFVDRNSVGFGFAIDEEYNRHYVSLNLSAGTYDIYLKHYKDDAADVWVVYIARQAASISGVDIEVDGTPQALTVNSSFSPNSQQESELCVLDLTLDNGAKISFVMGTEELSFYVENSNVVKQIPDYDAGTQYSELDLEKGRYDIYFKHYYDLPANVWVLYIHQKPLSTETGEVWVDDAKKDDFENNTANIDYDVHPAHLIREFSALGLVLAVNEEVTIKIDGVEIDFFVEFGSSLGVADVTTVNHVTVVLAGTYDIYLKNFDTDSNGNPPCWVMYAVLTSSVNGIDPAKYYVTGEVDGEADKWEPLASYLFVENPTKPGIEYMLLGVEFKAGDVIKGVKGNKADWFGVKDGIDAAIGTRDNTATSSNGNFTFAKNGVFNLYLDITAGNKSIWIEEVTTPPTLPAGVNASKYYLAGEINGITQQWEPLPKYELYLNPDNPEELMILGVSLKQGDIIKVVKGDRMYWVAFQQEIPQITGVLDDNGNLVIAQDGDYNFYLCENGVWAEKIAAAPAAPVASIHGFSVNSDTPDGRDPLYDVTGSMLTETLNGKNKVSEFSATVELTKGDILRLWPNGMGMMVWVENYEDFDCNGQIMSSGIGITIPEDGSYTIYLKFYDSLLQPSVRCSLYIAFNG